MPAVCLIIVLIDHASQTSYVIGHMNMDEFMTDKMYDNDNTDNKERENRNLISTLISYYNSSIFR